MNPTAAPRHRKHLGGGGTGLRAAAPLPGAPRDALGTPRSHAPIQRVAHTVVEKYWALSIAAIFITPRLFYHPPMVARFVTPKRRWGAAGWSPRCTTTGGSPRYFPPAPCSLIIRRVVSGLYERLRYFHPGLLRCCVAAASWTARSSSPAPRWRGW